MRFPTLHFLRVLIATNLKASFALRGAFWIQAVFMILNNLIFFTVWLLFFNRFEDVRGWRLPDMALLYGVIQLAFGLAVVFAGGGRELARTIVDGDLDAYITQPKPLLLHTVASRTYASGWGDMLCGVFLIGVSGYVTWMMAPVALLVSVCGAAVLVATVVLVGSLAFWIGPMNTLSRQIFEFTIMFSCYPATLFHGALRLLLFTAIPAGFISYLPSDVLRSFSWSGLGTVVGAAVLYTALALFVFHRGLRRYESGNRFGVRA